MASLKLLIISLTLVAWSAGADFIDLSTCGKTKGCLLNPDGCNQATCTQIVTWRVSPDDAAYVRFEMLTTTNGGPNKTIDYIAFGLSVNDSMIMLDTSVLTCPFNPSTGMISPYLAHNADKNNMPVPNAHDGLHVLKTLKSPTSVYCLTDRAIEPVDDQSNLTFALNQPWFPVLAAGPTDPTTGLIQRHFEVAEGSGNVVLTDYGDMAGIDLSGCDESKGCFRNPPNCMGLSDCSQIVTWQALGDGFVRFEMATTRQFDYIAFGLSGGEVMLNTSVLACAFNETSGMLQVFNSHNQALPSGHYASVITDQPQLGLRPILTTATSQNLICVVDRAVMPDESLNGIIFPLDQPWYPVWASGPTSDGQLRYHDVNKFKDPMQHVVTGPYLDVTKCDQTKGCLRVPQDCNSTLDCYQIVTYRVSPDDATKVRLELFSVTDIEGHQLDYVAFGLSVNSSTMMSNTSVIVCAKNATSGQLITYLSHNANSYSTPLTGDGSADGLEMVAWQQSSTFIHCVIDRPIQPLAGQNGLAFPLDWPWTPAIAAGPNNATTGFLSRHLLAQKFPDPVVLTAYSNATSIDLSQCNVVKGCILYPPGCDSFASCSQIITWSPSADSSRVKFEMSTVNAQNYIAFGLAGGYAKMDIMGNGSVLACAYNKTTGNMAVFNSHNQVNPNTGHFQNFVPEQAEAGIHPISLMATSDHYICILERDVKVDPVLNGIIFPLDEAWYPVWAAGPTVNGFLTYHDETKQKFPFKVIPAQSIFPVTPNLDLSTCGTMKGCQTNPWDCKVAGDCQQIVTWQVSPDDPTKVRFEMSTLSTYKGSEVDYIAFGLSVDAESLMLNTSVLACTQGNAYLSHNRNHTSTPLPGQSAYDGIDLLSSPDSSYFVQCLIDRNIEPTAAQAGLSFPLNMAWIPAIAAGPVDSSGIIEHHLYANFSDQPVILTDFANGTVIDVSQCNVTRGCLLNPPGCSSFDSCTQIVTWQLLNDGKNVRFEMSTTTSGGQIGYIAFGQTAGGIMTNGSVLACSFNQTSGMVDVFNSHNMKNNATGHYANVITDQPQLGLKPISLASVSNRIVCIVDKAVTPDPSLNGIIFPLDEPFYLAWAAGPASPDGHVTYHDTTKRLYDSEPVIVTHNMSPPDPLIPITTTQKPPVGPVIDLSSCDIEKGCYRTPANCQPASACSQIITWTVSPDDPAAVRFEMFTVMQPQVQYVAFGVTVDSTSVMKNTSVLVCAFNQTNSSATAYLSHNADGTSTPLPEETRYKGISMIESQVSDNQVYCLVDRKIAPSAEQIGLVFPLYQSFYPAYVAGPADSNGILHKHVATHLGDSPITVTDFTNQTAIDVSLCGIAHGCLRYPVDCNSITDCYQIVTWSVLQGGDYVRFQLSTTRTHEYIAFALAVADEIGFMNNASVLACVINDTTSELIAYHSHNQQLFGGYKSVITHNPTIGIRPVKILAGDDRLMCIIDQTVKPDPSLNGLIFPLDEPWYPGWATGPAENGVLKFHGDGDNVKMGYKDQIVCTKPYSPPAPPVVNVLLLKKLHGLFMAFGWMVFAACSILTPRYLRKHWVTMRYLNLQLWFVVHRTLMLMAVLFIVIAFWLILAAENYSFIASTPDGDDPTWLHSYFGLIAIILIFLNPVIAMFRPKPGHQYRVIFNWVHGLLGGLCFLLAATNLVLGGLMWKEAWNSSAVNLVYTWIALHGTVELVYLLIWWMDARKEDEESRPLAPADSTLSANRSASSISAITSEDTPSAAYKISTGIFLLYFVATLALASAVGGLIFVDASSSDN